MVISSYFETPAFLPTLERTLSEVEEFGDDDSDASESSDEDYEGFSFSSPRPAQPTEHAPQTRGIGSSALVPQEVPIRDDVAKGSELEPFVLEHKIRRDGINISGQDVP